MREEFLNWRSLFCGKAKLNLDSSLYNTRRKGMTNVFMEYISQETTSLCVWGIQKGDNLLTITEMVYFLDRLFLIYVVIKNKNANICLFVCFCLLFSISVSLLFYINFFFKVRITFHGEEPLI